MINVNGITIVDIVIIVILLYFVIRGYERGFIDQTSKIIGLVIALFIAVKQYEEFVVVLEPYLDLAQPLMYFISFIILFTAVNLVVHIVGLVFKRVVHFLFLGMLDNIGGALLGLLKGAILVYFLVFVLNEIPYQALVDLMEESYLANNFMELTPIIKENIEEIFGHS